jgi:type IV pilus secretin PilQ/predicted competence protein
MAGMKTRLAQIKFLASIKTKGPICKILFLLPTFAFLGFSSAQDEPNRSQPVQQSSPAAITEAVGVESAAPEVSKEPAETTAQLKPDLKPVVPASAIMPVPTEPAAKILSAPADPKMKTSAPATITAPATVQPGSRFSGQPLTLDFVDTPLVDFFRLLAEEGGVNIVLDPAVKGSISIKVAKLPWDQIFEMALSNNQLDKQVEGTLIRVAKKSTLQEEAKQEESLKKANLLAADTKTQIKRLNYAKAAELAKVLSDQKTPRGAVVVDERTNTLVLTDLPDSIEKLIKLIESLDVPQPQVEIEARIITSNSDFARDIGIQFGFIQGNTQRVTVGGASTSPNKQNSLSSSSSASMNAGNYNVNLPAGRIFGGAGISIGNIFDTFLLDAAITAGEAKGSAQLISRPRITVQNNSPAVVTQGVRFPVPVNANNTVTIQFFNAALNMTVTPQITAEGNILLDLKVENNTPDFSNKVMDVPSIRTSESSTRVLVSDGATAFISGIKVENDSTAKDKIPGLGDIPGIGRIFSRSSIVKNKQEVSFFITTTIVK